MNERRSSGRLDELTGIGFYLTAATAKATIASIDTKTTTVDTPMVVTATSTAMATKR